MKIKNWADVKLKLNEIKNYKIGWHEDDTQPIDELTLKCAEEASIYFEKYEKIRKPNFVFADPETLEIVFTWLKNQGKQHVEVRIYGETMRTIFFDNDESQIEIQFNDD